MAVAKTKRKKSSSKRQSVVSINRAVLPKPVTEVVTEKTYITTEPEVEIRKPATLSQALTEPAVAVVKPKTRVRKEIQTTARRRA